MAYIGRELTSGNYLKLDDISSQFNGSTKTFNLTAGGQAFYAGSAFSLLVSLGGVIQEPESAYQINQNQITFAVAPGVSDDFFCIVLGVSLGVGVPGEGTVSGSKLTKPFNYNSGLLYLDDTNNRIGIGTNNPQTKLQIGGVLGFDNTNTKIGDNTTGASITSGTSNNFIGVAAGNANQGGSNNNFFGFYAGFSNQNASNNNFIGAAAGYSNSSGVGNNFFGLNTGLNNSSGSSNNFIGIAAGISNQTGSNNIFLGARNGISASASYKVIIGSGYLANYFDSPNTTKDYQFAVGIRTDANASKYWLVGDENFNIGIGTNNPTTTLDVGGEVTIRRTAPGNEGGQLNLARASDNASAWYLDVYGSTSTPDLRVVDATAAAVRMQIDGSGRVVTPFQPIFQAYGVSGGTFASGNYWIFPSTLVNIGNHYNTSNGIFTAPVAGTYCFNWSNIGNSVNDTYRYRIRKNNADIGDWHLRLDTTATGIEYADSATRTIFVQLAVNDTIRIYFLSDSGNSSYPSGNSSTDTYPTFGGYLMG